jgi:hypothetical protein
MTPGKLLGIVFSLVMSLTFLPATGWAAGAPTKLTLDGNQRVDSKGAKAAGQYLLTATLTSADGKPLGNREVQYFETASLFGNRDAFVGVALTDTSGTAVLLYQPAATGGQQLKAQFAGDSQGAGSQAAFTLNVSSAVAPFQPAPLPLGGVASVLTVGVCTVAVTVWGVLLWVLLHSVASIRKAARIPETRAAV